VTKCGGPAVDKKAVELRGAVKTVGSHKASIKLHPGVTASVTFEVVAI
jgi:large subunit ribosomal protein L9